MRNFKKAAAVIMSAMLCFCAVLCAGAAENGELRINATAVGGYELEIELENVSDYYLANVQVKIEDSVGEQVSLAAYNDDSAESSAATAEAVETGTASTDDEKAAEAGAGFIRSMAPGESVKLFAALDYGDEPVKVMPSKEIPPVTLWIALGVAAIAAVIVAFAVHKKKKGRNISAVLIAAMLLGAFSSAGYAEDHTVLTGSDNTDVTTEAVTELEEAVLSHLTETLTASGKGDIEITAEYTVVPHAVTNPLKNNRRPSDNDECNTPQVHQRRLVEDSGPLTDHNIYIGENDFMFYGTEIDDYTGKSVLEDSRLKKLGGMMDDRDEWAKENGIKLYLVICPDKSSVYPEYVPEKLTAAEKTAADIAVEYLAENSSVEVIDLREPLKNAKEEYGDSLYYKYDTHWNNNGGFVGYTEIMRHINEDAAGAYTLQKDDFAIEEYETYMKDMAYYLGYYNTYTDHGPVYTLKSGMTAELGRTESDGNWGQYMFCYKWDDGYSDALKYITYTNHYNEGAPSVYMYRDSFAVSLVHFIKDSFYESTFDWSYDFSRNEILESEADIVIMEIVERNLYDFVSTRTFSD